MRVAIGRLLHAQRNWAVTLLFGAYPEEVLPTGSRNMTFRNPTVLQ